MTAAYTAIRHFEATSLILLLLITTTLNCVDCFVMTPIGSVHGQRGLTNMPNSNKFRPSRPLYDALTLSSPLLSCIFEDSTIKEIIEAVPATGIQNVAAPSLSEGVSWMTSSLTLASPLLSESQNPDLIVAEILGFASHVSLDMMNLFRCGALVTRAMKSLGWMFSLFSLYLPEHTMLPEEFAFQTFMLILSLVGLVKAYIPIIRESSSASEISISDGRIFKQVFEPVGITWEKYKTLSAVSSMEWATQEPGETIGTSQNLDDGSEDSIFLLYEGSVCVESKGKHPYTIARSKAKREAVTNDSSNNLDQILLFGEEQLARQMKLSSATIQASPITTYKAGPEGAKVLRINASKVIDMMNDDEDLASSMHRLLFTGMQTKMNALLVA